MYFITLQGLFHQSCLGSNFWWSLLYLIIVRLHYNVYPAIMSSICRSGGGGRATKQIVFTFYILKGNWHLCVYLSTFAKCVLHV